MKNYFISRDLVCLKNNPKEDVKEGIVIKYLNMFTKERKDYKGVIYCDIHAGQEVYYLPPNLRGLNKLRIYSIKICKK